jgi:hypothetical protein
MFLANWKANAKDHLTFIKRTMTRDFRPSLGFFIDQLHLGPWLTAQARFAFGVALAEKINAKAAKICFRVVNGPTETEYEVKNSPTFFLWSKCMVWGY